PALVTDIAWTKVAQAVATVAQSLTSLPVPETKLMLLSAWAGVPAHSASTAPIAASDSADLVRDLIMKRLPVSGSPLRPSHNESLSSGKSNGATDSRRALSLRALADAVGG